jgi:EAL domain-containing protein (putative c-di-GMP-specific phosphodiesterase class I)
MTAGACPRHHADWPRRLGFRWVAEGIEEPEQLRELNGMSCEYGQGYLFSRPVPFDDALKLASQSFWEV